MRHFWVKSDGNLKPEVTRLIILNVYKRHDSSLTFVLRGAADGEGVPLVACDDGDLDEHVVPGLEVEPSGPGDDQVGHLGNNNIVLEYLAFR